MKEDEKICKICNENKCEKDNEHIDAPAYFKLFQYPEDKIHICGECQTKLSEKIRSHELDKEIMPEILNKKISDYHQLFSRIKEVIYSE